MTLLSWLHRWTGGIVGLLLAILGLSGTVLLWEDSWILLPGAGDPVANDPAMLGRSVAAALEAGPELSRLTFASEEIGLHQAVYADGSGAYFAQDGALVDRWASFWERPELWLFDLHHYLLMGETGKTVTGILGLLLLAFCISGLVLWWRTRKTFRFRLWPARFTASAVVRHHRDLGAVASPLLILVAFTGAMMVFPAISGWLLSPLAHEMQDVILPDDLTDQSAQTDWALVMTRAQAAFPDAEPRRLMLPAEAGAPIAIRFRQDFEWTPNGRTYVWLDPGSAGIVGTSDPAKQDLASAATEKFYPVHAGKIGGMVWRLLLTASGLALVLLGALATWSFWTRQATDISSKRAGRWSSEISARTADSSGSPGS